jgi:hypothetical protein
MHRLTSIFTGNDEPGMLYSKLSTLLGLSLVGGDALGMSEGTWKGLGYVLAGAGLLALVVGKILLKRLDVFVGMPERLDADAARAAASNADIRQRLSDQDHALQRISDKQDAGMALQSQIVRGLIERLDAGTAAQRRTDERVDRFEYCRARGGSKC